jgi:hypothetical protein
MQPSAIPPCNVVWITVYIQRRRRQRRSLARHRDRIFMFWMSTTSNAARFAAGSASRLIEQNELPCRLSGRPAAVRTTGRVVLLIVPVSEDHTCRPRAAAGYPGVELNLSVLLVRAAARTMQRVCKTGSKFPQSRCY